jgi:hypothetical protein
MDSIYISSSCAARDFPLSGSGAVIRSSGPFGGEKDWDVFEEQRKGTYKTGYECFGGF